MKKTLIGLTIAAFVIEVLMAIPVLGGTLIMGTYYLPLVIALTLHGAVLVLRVVVKKQESLESVPLGAPITGVVASCLGVIPFVGWGLHLATAILYLIEIANGKHKI